MLDAAPLHDRAATSAPRLGYRPELDGVRGVAILLVLLAHSSAFVRSGRGLLYFGFFGVDLFFVLSGFLITTLLLEEGTDTGRIGIGAFYRRRAWRLLPALLLGVSLAGAAALVIGANLNGIAFPKAAALALGFAANWSGRSLGLLAHTWSLAVEAQFYVLWPLLIAICVRRGVRGSRMAVTAIVAGLAVAALRAMAVHGVGPVDMVHGVYRTDAILFGSALGVLLITERERIASVLARRRIAEAAIAGLLGYAAYVEIGGRFGVAALTKDLLFVGNVAAAVLLASVVIGSSRWSRSLSAVPFVTIGRLSYSLYLVHYPVFRTLARVGPDSGWTSAIIGWTISFALAALSYRLVEQPALRLKNRLAERKRERLLDGESVGRRGDAGLEVQRRGREEELVDAV